MFRSFRNYSRQYIHCSSKTTSVLQRFSKSVGMSTSAKTREMEKFQQVLPKIVDILSKSEKFSQLPEVMESLRQIIDTNVEGGKKIRGITTVYAYEYFEKPENVNEEKLVLARIAGWCVEMMQAYFLITDDIMDSSLTRRGSPCWYRHPEVGLRAINDAIMVKCTYFEIFKMIFKDKPYYVDIIELIHDTLFCTSIGQHLDVVTTKDFKNFTKNRYNAIVKNKTALYTYNLPLTLGYLLTNNTNKEDLRIITELSIDIGSFFQIQDDFIDVYGDPNMTGKLGSDIQEGKCSWMAVTALEKCTEQQRKYFEAHYGSKEEKNVEKIKQLYEQLELRKLYSENEMAMYEEIKMKIDKLPAGLSPKLFGKLLDTLYQRKI